MRTYDVKFDGRVRSFFPILFFGTIGSIISLGLGAAYFECKIKDYLCRKTSIGKAHLRYLVNPQNALLNRLKASAIGLGITVVLSGLSVIPLVGPAIVIVSSFVIYDFARKARLKGLVFRTYNTTVGNIRCGFRSNYNRSASDALMVFPIWGGLLPFLRPYTKWRIHLFLLNNIWVGTNRLKFKAGLSDYLFVYVPEMLLYILCLPVVVVFWEAYGFYTLFTVPLTWVFASTYTRYTLDNLVRRNITLGKLRFSGSTDYAKLLTIRLTNAVVVILTVGLAFPWAKLRELRYRLQCTRVVALGQERSLLGTELIQPDALSDQLEEVLAARGPSGEVGEALAEESVEGFDNDFENIKVDV
ncbi:MAG: DUF898 family protein [Candidatus Thiodiazotropha sp. DIVDIV]